MQKIESKLRPQFGEAKLRKTLDSARNSALCEPDAWTTPALACSLFRGVGAFSEHPVLADVAGMAVALVFAFPTFEAIRQGVTNAVITGFGVTVAALAGAAACLAWLAHREEIVSHRRLRSLATTDSQWRAAQRKRVPLPVLFIDIDSFKRFNDTLGHEVGDEVLRTVAKGISAVVAGAGGFVARYDGDEFGVVLGNVSPARAERLAWAIRRGVEDMRIQTHGLGHGTLTVSAGCVICEPPCALRADELMEAADGQLNAAKAAGRNRVCSLTLNGGALAIAEDVSPGWPKSAAPAAV